MHELHDLFNNSFFWGFLGTLVVAYFGYKGALVPYMEKLKLRQYHNGQITNHPKINVKRVSSFDELKAVVEILQGELERKDKMMQLQDERHRKELAAAYARIDELYGEIDKLKIRLHNANINEE